MSNQAENIVGIIPMAGTASRLGKIPQSKELIPVGKNGQEAPEAVSLHLIKSMQRAGVKDIHLVLRDGKWDIPSFFKSGKNFGFNAGYHVASYGYGVPFTINEAYPFVKDKCVVLGFPDILFTTDDVFSSMIEALSESDTSVVLGSMQVKDPEKWDMLETTEDGIVKRILIKSKAAAKLKNNWFLAVWKPEFSHFLNSTVESLLDNYSDEYLESNEYQLGEVMNAAMEQGMKIKSELFKDGKCLDIGTPQNLKLANSFLN